MSIKAAAKPSSDILKKKKAAILHRWQDLVFETYAPDTAAILKTGDDRFENPVSYTICSNLELILDSLADGKEVETALVCLEEIIRIRAVQDFTPEMAVCFMPLLKKAIVTVTGTEIDPDLTERIDSLSAACNDIYLECRNRIERIKAGEKLKTARNMARLVGLQEDVK